MSCKQSAAATTQIIASADTERGLGGIMFASMDYTVATRVGGLDAPSVENRIP